ncbi:J domain-containing protein [Fervidobacterium pennivorans]|uniref:J domain-containing protein n=1 Tax=Fervidobacterium pennivorans TaxID=93466 RepID=UPI001BC89934|nr:J domain-containing protein [Fervidobacterium pennivorans]
MLIPYGIFRFFPTLIRDFIVIVLIAFAFVTFIIISSLIKGKVKTQQRQQKTAEQNESCIQAEDENSREYQESSTHSFEINTKVDKLDIQEAFRILGLRPGASYTKVSERYYELVKKVNNMKISEAHRQIMLEELAKAYEVLTEHYSKMS